MNQRIHPAGLVAACGILLVPHVWAQNIIPRGPNSGFLGPSDRQGLDSLKEGVLIGEPITQYGNWYGPGWWGGSNNTNKPGNAPPVDSLDACAQRHDFGYQVAEKYGKIYGKSEERRLKGIADMIAVRDAMRLPKDPRQWPHPPQNPEEASRYRDRIITGFDYTASAYTGAAQIGKGADWVTSPIENWELDTSHQLDPADLEKQVTTLLNNWNKTNPPTPKPSPPPVKPPPAVSGGGKTGGTGSSGAGSGAGGSTGGGVTQGRPPAPPPAGGTTAGGPAADDGSPRNDAGQKVDPGQYQGGDMIITKDGTEYRNKDGQWVKTGRTYEPYDPKGDLDKNEGGGWAEGGGAGQETGSGAGIEGFTATTDGKSAQHGKDSYTQMGLNQAVKEATTSGDKTADEAQQVVDKGGRDAQETAGKTAAEIAKADRENSWGKAIGDAVQQGVESGAKAAGEAFGTAAADRATKEIFEGGRRKGTTTSDTGDEGQEPDGKVVAGGKPTPRDKEVAGVGKKTPPVSGGSAGGAQKTSNTSGGSGGKTSTTDRGAYVYLVDCRKCGYREGPVKIASSSAVPSSKPCSRCGSTDIQEWAGYESLIPRPSAVSTSTNAVPETAAGTTPPAAPVPPAPPPAPEKKQRCPRCKSPDIYHSHDHYMYGAVYKCRACDNSFRSVYIVYE